MDFWNAVIAAAASPMGDAGGESLGSELWPQPDFDASTNLTLTRATVSGGLLNMQDLGAPSIASATSPLTLENGQSFRWAINVTANAGDKFYLQVGGGAGGSVTMVPVTGQTGEFTGTITLTAAPVNQLIRVSSDGDATCSATSFSLKQIL